MTAALSAAPLVVPPLFRVPPVATPVGMGYIRGQTRTSRNNGIASYAGFSGAFWTLADSRKQKSGGGGGIRTHVTVSRKHAFQACAFSHSATPPYRLPRRRAHHSSARRRAWKV